MLWFFRHCGRLLRRTVSYNMQSQRSQESQQNPVYGQPTTSGVTPEPESVSGCEIYEGQDDILTYGTTSGIRLLTYQIVAIKLVNS